MLKINKELLQLFGLGDALDDSILLRYERQLITAYQKARKSIVGQISAMYEKYGDDVTYDEMASFNRLTNLEQEINQQLNGLGVSSKSSISNSIKSSYQTSYQYSGFAMERALQVKMGFGLLSEKQVQAVLLNPLKHIKWTDSEKANIISAQLDIRNKIADGLIQGKGFSTTASEVKDSLDISFNRAMRIIQTETHRVQTAGRLAGMDQGQKAIDELGMESERMWLPTRDARTRPNHGAMDGKPAKVQEDGTTKFRFTTAQGNTILVSGPGLTGTTDDINCVMGETKVISPKIKKATRRYYEGELIEIITRNNVITASPNHPILTDKGFIPFDLINEKSNILNCSFSKYISSSNPKPNYRPVKISKVFGFAGIIGRKERVTGTKPQFHGDGFNSNVDIISPDSFLWNSIQSLLFKKVNYKEFVFTNFRKCLFFCKSRLNHFFFGTFPSTGSYMTSSCLSAPFVGTHLRPFNRFGFTLSSSIDAVFPKNPGDNITANIKRFCKSIFGNSIDITIDNVRNIRRFNFKGHLYNLETVNDFYLATNIQKRTTMFNVLHNCRCTVFIQFEEFPINVRKDNETKKIIPQTSYNDWYKKKYGKAPNVPKTKGLPKVAFTPVKTLSEAESYAKKFAKGVDYKGIPLDQANRINKRLNELFTQYPKLRKLERIWTITDRFGRAAGNGAQLKLSTKAMFYEGGGEKAFLASTTEHKAYVDSRIKWLKDRLKKEVKGSDAYKTVKFRLNEAETEARFSRHTAYVKGQEVESTITHEFGHVIDDQLSGRINAPLRNKTLMSEAKMLEFEKEWQFIADNIGDDIYNISEYAATDAQELFAEAFEMYSLGEEANLPQEIIKYFEEYLGYMQ